MRSFGASLQAAGSPAYRLLSKATEPAIEEQTQKQLPLSQVDAAVAVVLTKQLRRLELNEIFQIKCCMALKKNCPEFGRRFCCTFNEEGNNLFSAPLVCD